MHIVHCTLHIVHCTLQTLDTAGSLERGMQPQSDEQESWQLGLQMQEVEVDWQQLHVMSCHIVLISDISVLPVTLNHIILVSFHKMLYHSMYYGKPKKNIESLTVVNPPPPPCIFWLGHFPKSKIESESSSKKAKQPGICQSFSRNVGET